MPLSFLGPSYKVPSRLVRLAFAVLLLGGCGTLKPNERPPTDAGAPDGDPFGAGTLEGGVVDSSETDTSAPVVCGDLPADATELWVDGSNGTRSNAGTPGYDVGLLAPSDVSITLSFSNNLWDHAPPTIRGPGAPNGTDVMRADGANATLDVGGATTVTNAPCTRDMGP
jgi:hypothetical protein